MDNTITAQELKTKGVQIFKSKLKNNKEALITVRGENSFVVMTIEQYEFLRGCELESAIRETEADLAAGRFSIETPEEHIKKLKKSLNV